MKILKTYIARALVLFMILFNINTSIGSATINTTLNESTFSTLSNINNVVIFIDFNDTNSFNGDEIKAREVENAFNDFLDSNGDGISDEDKICIKSYI